MIKFLALLIIISIACNNPQVTGVTSPPLQTPKATGDSIALQLARDVILACGGLEEWNAIHYLSFNFFDSRLWYWDKWSNRYRVESLRRSYRIAGTLDGKETYLFANGKVETNADSLSAYGKLAHNVWINDTYWLMMPFKLLDEGVQLSYKGVLPIDSTTSAKCIELTFDSVGVTPENKYLIYIDSTNHSIIHWSYFEQKNDTLPQLSNAWTDYKSYGNIKLSSGRGERSLKDIKIAENVPDHFFKDVSVPAKDLK